MSDAPSSTFTPVPLDKSKRTWLIASTCAGAAGAAALATPFVSSFAPSEKAKAAGAAVEVDIASLKPGEKLDEGSLASRFDVSRTPVREALRQLGAMGLVKREPNRSAVVTTIDADHLNSIFEAMAELEPLVAGGQRQPRVRRRLGHAGLGR